MVLTMVEMAVAEGNTLKIVVVRHSIPLLNTLNPKIAMFAKFATNLGMWLFNATSASFTAINTNHQIHS